MTQKWTVRQYYIGKGQRDYHSNTLIRCGGTWLIAAFMHLLLTLQYFCCKHPVGYIR